MQHLPYLFNMYMEGYPGQKWLLAVLLEAKVIPLRVSILVKYNVSNIFSANYNNLSFIWIKKQGITAHPGP